MFPATGFQTDEGKMDVYLTGKSTGTSIDV